MPIGCMSPVTQEDFLCDDCREGCNAAFGSAKWEGAEGEANYLGFHMKTEITFGPVPDA